MQHLLLQLVGIKMGRLKRFFERVERAVSTEFDLDGGESASSTPPENQRTVGERLRTYLRDSSHYPFRYAPSQELISRKYREGFESSFAGANRLNIPTILEQRVCEFQENMGGAIVSVAFHDLKKRMPDFYINARKLGWAASIIKVPVMIETVRAVDNGRLSLDEELIVDHCYTLEVTDHVRYLPMGTGITVRELLHHMIVSSDNEATNMLAEKCGLENINQTMQKLGANRTMLAHLLAPKVPRLYTSWNPEGSNLTTARDMTQLLTGIYTDTSASAESCAQMREILERQGGVILGQYLPHETIIGGKVGMISDPATGDDVHDVGVINGDYVLSIMCNRIGRRGIKETEQTSSFSSSYRTRRFRQGRDLVQELQWRAVEAVLDKIHELTKVQFYFAVQGRAVPYYKPSDPSEVIGIISKVVHDVYYKGKVERLGQ